MIDIVYLFATAIIMSIVFYFGSKILKTSWGTALKVLSLLSLILVASGFGVAVALFLINLLGLQIKH